MAMDQFLAEYFGNNVKTASAPEVDPTEAEKVAQMEIFTKLAADNGIDLEKLSEEQIAYLWGETFKEASGDAPKEDEKEDEKEKESEGDPAEAKKEEAKKEHEEKKEAMAKVAEAAYLGKVMAHSLVAELREISKEASAETETDPGEQPGEGEGEAKEAAMPAALAKALGKGKDLAGKAGKAVSGAAGKAGDAAKGHGAALKAHATGKGTHVGLHQAASKGKEIAGKAVDTAKKHKVPAAAAAGGAAAGAAAGYAAGRKKESSAIDELALEAAVEKAAEAGFDAEEAAQRVLAVHTLGLLGESEKVAAAADADAAVDVRALELLETAGYPVTWNE